MKNSVRGGVCLFGLWGTQKCLCIQVLRASCLVIENALRSCVDGREIARSLEGSLWIRGARKKGPLAPICEDVSRGLLA